MKHWEEMSERERDALVAEKVMGWTVEWGTRLEDASGLEPVFRRPGDVGWCRPYFTTDIAAAWEVVKKMKEDGWNLCMEIPTGDLVVVSFWKGGQWEAPDDIATNSNADADAPEAICLAALRAKGVDA